jgi:cell division protein FtsB
MKNENDYLKRENEFLKKEFIRLFGTYPTMDGKNIIQGNFMQNVNQSQSRREEGILTFNLDGESDKIKTENNKIKKDKEMLERQNTNLKNENDILVSKLNNLETVFIGSNIVRNKDGTVTNEMGEDYTMSAVKKFNQRLC